MEIQKQEPLFLQAYGIIKYMILTSWLKPGDRLYEVRLAKELNVSRNPIREALRLLMQDGLVCGTPKGLIVNPMNLKNIKEIYECRTMVEPFAASLAAKRITREQVKKLHQYVDKAEKSYQKGDMDEVIESNSKFHELIVLLSENKQIYSIFKTIDNLVIVSRNIEMKVNNRPSDYLEEHRQIIYLLEESDSINIQSLMKEHIMNDWKYFIKCSQNTQKSLNDYNDN